MITLREMEEAEIERLYALRMQRDFPSSELKHLSSILALHRQEVYDVLGAYQDGTRIAYALVYCPRQSDVFLLDYLAVEPEMRSRGIGSEVLGLLREYYQGRADALVIECERPKTAPDESTARKRIRFYQQAGAQLTTVRIWLFDVEYSILVLPCAEKMPALNWAQQILSLYRQMVPPELFEKNVRLIRA